MKKGLLYSLVALILIIVLCLGLAACSIDTSKVAGIYELIEINENELKYADIIYCDLTLDAKGQYILEYKISDSKNSNEKSFEKGNFVINDDIIEFKDGSLKGSYDIQIKLLRVNLIINGKQTEALFVYSDNL